MADPFKTLGVEPQFDLDLGAVELRHRDLSKALHPDRYSGAPAAERRMALGRAIEVNDAWRIVRDPVKRAEALLRRAGVAVGETNEPKPSPELLMEMMELREALGDASRAKDLPAIEELAEKMRTREKATLGAIARGFAAADGEAERLRTVVPVLGELRYVRRFLEEVGAIEEQLVG